jgi:hypothetical protein
MSTISWRSSSSPITAIGLDVTLRVWLTEREVEQLRHLPNGLGPLLEGANQTMVEVFGTEPEQPARSISGISDGTA